MNIVRPYAEIVGDPCNINDGIQMLKRVEKFARLSHRSEDRTTGDSWDKLLRAVVMQHGDMSVVEHEFVTAFVTTDRGISHEWVRHRIPWQYTQESTRFCNYGKIGGGIDVIEPPGLDAQKRFIWVRAMKECEEAYLSMLRDEYCGGGLGTLTQPGLEQRPASPKVSPQIARSVLPTCLATRFYATSNLRGWRHFFLMRTCAEAHPQMKEITTPLLADFQARIPILFEDIVPGERQALAAKRLQ